MFFSQNVNNNWAITCLENMIAELRTKQPTNDVTLYMHFKQMIF